MVIVYIILGIIAIAAFIFLGMYISFIFFMFVIYSLDAASNGKFIDPELRAEFEEMRKKFSIRHFLKLITFFKNH